MIHRTSASLMICAFLALAAAGFCNDGKPLRIDFSAEKAYDSFSKYPAEWDYKSTWMVPDSKMYVIKDPETGTKILKMESSKDCGTLLYYKFIGKLDLTKTPIMRWKWKVAKLPAGGDARYQEKDDQAIGLYVGYGRVFRKSVSYRWETESPVGSEGNATYARVVSVRWHCIRNKESELNKWYVDERNLADDFKRDYGEVPTDVVITVSINSEYTGTQAESYLEYIEFVPAGTPKQPNP